jgi:hypothetical protein
MGIYRKNLIVLTTCIYLLLKLYKGSLVAALSAVYSDFKPLPAEYWDNKENQIRFMDDLGKLIGVTTWQDWYSIPPSKVLNRLGAGFLKTIYNGSLITGSSYSRIVYIDLCSTKRLISKPQLGTAQL